MRFSALTLLPVRSLKGLGSGEVDLLPVWDTRDQFVLKLQC